MIMPRKNGTLPKSVGATQPAAATGTESPRKFRLKVFGIGGAGCNIVTHIASMLASKDTSFDPVDLVAVNTDAQALQDVTGIEKLPIGATVLRGLSAGGDPEMGMRAAQEQTERIEAMAQHTDILFIAAGMGGGTGGGAAPVVARLAKGQGALVLGFAVMPFGFEGERKRQQALMCLEQFRGQADAVIVFPNDKLLKLAGENASMPEAFACGNEMVGVAVRSIWQLLARKGLINLDFGDLRGTLAGRHGDCCFSHGEAEGGEAGRRAAEAALKHPLLDGGDVLTKAESLLVSISGGSSLVLGDVQKIMEPISRQAPQAKVVMGATIDESAADKVSVIIIAATGHSTRRAVELRTTIKPYNAAPTPKQSEPVGQSLAAELTTPEAAPEPATAAKTKSKKVIPKQESLPFESVSKGRFEKTEPTLCNGEDLDVPTFIRRGVSLRK
jgi:cell division protein FtsZ